MSWANKFSKPYRVEHGKKFRLKDHDPADTAKLHSQEHAEELLAKGVARMAELQDKLYAAESLGPASDLSSHGCRRKRRRHQARDVRASIRRAARSTPSRRPPRKSWTTTICGAT